MIFVSVVVRKIIFWLKYISASNHFLVEKQYKQSLNINCNVQFLLILSTVLVILQHFRQRYVKSIGVLSEEPSWLFQTILTMLKDYVIIHLQKQQKIESFNELHLIMLMTLTAYLNVTFGFLVSKCSQWISQTETDIFHTVCWIRK